MKKIRVILLTLMGTMLFCSGAAADEKAAGDILTRAFPAAVSRMICVENENALGILFRTEGDPCPQSAYVIDDAVAHLRLQITAADDPSAVSFRNLQDSHILEDLFDPERGEYVIDLPMPDAGAKEHYVYCSLAAEGDEDTDTSGVYLIAGDEYIDELVKAMSAGGSEISWEYADPEQPDQTQLQAYILHITDQDGAPVPGMMVNFCTDTACIMQQSDESGTITFEGEPDNYHVQLLKAPEGFSFDPDFELYTGTAYSEWLIRICRDIRTP